jgi:Spy/CpxP family protein refolding chaperone
VREGERDGAASDRRPEVDSLIRLAVAVAVSVLLVMAVLAARRTEGGDAVLREAVPFIESEATGAPVLARLGLDDTQKERVERLRAEERPRVEWLRRALAEIEQEIRREELASPFDAERVNGLVGGQAELTAHLRGTESRLVSRIAELLTSEQRRRLAELRVDGAPRAEAPSASNSHAPPFAPRVGTPGAGPGALETWVQGPVDF